MKRLKSYIIFQIIIVIAAYLGCWYERKELLELIEHNRNINSIIVVLFLISSFYILCDALLAFYKTHLWLKHKNVLSEKHARQIFGNKYYNISDISNAQKEMITLWKTSLEWKSNIIEYISGTLIGVGLLGTFIGLMHTMGSVFNVLSTSVSGKDLVSELGVPLSGMSTAFSASMLGLSTSLTIGLLGVITSKINNEFVSEIETNTIEVEQHHDDILQNKQGHYFLKKLLLEVEGNSQNGKALMNIMDSQLSLLHSISETMSYIAENNYESKILLKELNLLLTDNNVTTEVVKIHLETTIKNNIENNIEQVKSLREIGEGIIGVKTLINNNDNALRKIQQIQDVVYETGFVNLKELTTMRRIIDAAFACKNIKSDNNE